MPSVRLGLLLFLIWIIWPRFVAHAESLSTASPAPSPSVDRSSRDSDTLVFCSYNIYMGGIFKRGGDRRGHLKRVISRISPDVLALQECHGWDKDGQKNLHDFEQATGLKGILFSGRSGGHVALFHPETWSVRHQQRDFPALQNGGGVVDFDLPGGSQLCVGAFHLYAWSEDTRLKEIKEIAHAVDHKRRTVLLGDFNGLPAIDACAPADVEALPEQYRSGEGPGWRVDVSRHLFALGLVDCALVAPNAQRVTTYPTPGLPDPACPNIRIDAVLVSSDLQTQVTSYQCWRRKPADSASDHYPVVADVQLTHGDTALGSAIREDQHLGDIWP